MQISQAAALVQHLDDILSLIGPEMARKSTTNYNAHPRPGPEEIELEKLFLAGLFLVLLPGQALDM